MSRTTTPTTVGVCLWCGSSLDDDAEHLDRRTRCGRCGAATTIPIPTAEELAAAYGDWYRPEVAGRFSFAGDAILARTRGVLAARVDRIAPSGPVLDVGAGDGTLVDALRARGRDAVGLERDPVRDDLRDEALADVDESFAAIVFWHSLEHLPDPADAIRQAARLLSPGGILFVAVPNNDSIQARAFGNRWLHLDLPRHLVHLSTRSLSTGLQDQGFVIERTSFLRGGQLVIGWLHGLVGMLPGHPDLYQALRRQQARQIAQPALARVAAIVAGIALLPIAAVGTVAEVVVRRAGTVYLEARRV